LSSYDSALLSYIMFLKQKVGLNIKQIEKVHCTSLPPYSCWYIINSQFVKTFFSKDGSCSSIVLTLTFRHYHIKSSRKERKLAFITFFLSHFWCNMYWYACAFRLALLLENSITRLRKKLSMKKCLLSLFFAYLLF
jgi:hypothetical protein